MFKLLLIVFVFAAIIIILTLSMIGAILSRKKPVQPDEQIEPENVIDVTPRDVQ